MRDRLIELLKQANEVCAKRFREETKAVLKQKGCFNSKKDRVESFNEITADHLIENGVILPPCKVGDSVYYNHPELKETCPAKVIEITINHYTPSDPMWIKIEFFSKLIGIHTMKLSCFAFKKGCHNTKEEAEKALRSDTE
jgi:hypothetical protein